MATVTLECIVNVTGSTASFRTNPSQNSASPLVINKGDSVRFSFKEEGSASGYNFVVYQFGGVPNLWLDTSNTPQQGANTSVSRATNSAYAPGPSGVVSTLVCDCYGFVGADYRPLFTAMYIKVIEPADTTPSTFNVGADVLNAELNTRVPASPITVSGINAGTLATCTGSGVFTVNGGGFVTSATVYNGDSVQLFLDSAGTHSTLRTTTLNIGGVTDAFSVTTKAPGSTGVTKTITCRINYNSETGVTSASFLPPNSNASPLVVVKGDAVQFTFQQTGEASGYTSVIYDFASGYWINTSNSPNLAPGQSFTRLTNMDASVGSGFIDTLIFDAYGSPSRFTPFYIQIMDSLDATPDQFDVGSNVTGVAPADRIAGVPFTLTGMNTTATASCSAGCDFTVNNGLSTTSATVKNGDRIQLFVTASAGWSSAVTGTLWVGSVSDSMTVTTVGAPALNQLILFPKTAVPIGLNEVINFFGGTSLAFPPARNMRAYLRGGIYVPDISQNNTLPASGDLKLSQFANKATALIFSSYPKAQNVSGNTTAGLTTLSITWGVGVGGSTGFDVGYGPGMKGAVEYRYVVTEKTTGMLSTGLLVNSNTGSPGTWSADNTHLTISQSHNNLERRYAGTITIQVRSKVNNAVVVSATASYSLNFYGP